MKKSDFFDFFLKLYNTNLRYFFCKIAKIMKKDAPSAHKIVKCTLYILSKIKFEDSTNLL